MKNEGGLSGLKRLLLVSTALMMITQGVALAAAGPTPSPVDAVVSDYQAVRKVALALTVIGFLLGVARLGGSDDPGERHRAQGLVTLTGIAFLVLVGDRMLVQGIAGWFGLPTSELPVFWQ